MSVRPPFDSAWAVPSDDPDDQVEHLIYRRRGKNSPDFDVGSRWKYFFLGVLVCCCVGAAVNLFESTLLQTNSNRRNGTGDNTRPTDQPKRYAGPIPTQQQYSQSLQEIDVSSSELLSQPDSPTAIVTPKLVARDDSIPSPGVPQMSPARRGPSGDAVERQYVCRWMFVGYEPSQWEQDWSTNITQWQTRVCETLAEAPHSDRSMLMVMKVQEWQLAEDSDHKQKREPMTEAVKANQPEEGLPTWTSRELDQEAEALMSKNKFELRCRLTNPSQSTNRETTNRDPDSLSFVVATGYDFLEPLVGLLRDPLTICPTQGPRTPKIAALQRDIRWSTQEAMQSKRFVLPLSATPFHVELVTGGPHSPAFLTHALQEDIMAGVKLMMQEIGLPPWAYRSSHLSLVSSTDAKPNPPGEVSSSHSPEAPQPRTWPYLHQPSVSYDASSRKTWKRKTGEWILSTSGVTEEDHHTGIFLTLRDSFPSTDAGWDSQGADKLAKSSVSIPSMLSSRGATSGGSLSRGGPRHLLFDLGASYFGNWRADSSAQGSSWFYNQLKKKGLTFDHVWAYEYQKLDPYEEWNMIPSDLYPGFTFINSGVTSDPASKLNPWNTLLKVARPSDYVIIKLDIDTPSIEIPLFQQILAEPALQGLIDEMYFEHHVDVKEMRHWWGNDLPEQLSHSYRYFTQLRELGIRMHSWP